MVAVVVGEVEVEQEGMVGEAIMVAVEAIMVVGVDMVGSHSSENMRIVE
jgi:hypothetical protein